ncbi:hypothetical protein SSX86_028515 [Deinandra increscens subsp. villosa]|uniref:Integrase catalytic domain-containing protein n=1 Tax=Deinandra increscens subsp. villosa TaxID=3103831 RepID=A0AAP0CD51_9ASTR
MANIQVLKDWFDRVDSDQKGGITSIQLQRALAVGNLQFPLTIVQQMIRMYDFDRNGTMSFEEFVALNKFLLKVARSQEHMLFCHYPKFTSLFITEDLLVELVLLRCSTSVLRFGEVHYSCIFEWGRGFLVPDEVYEALLKLNITMDSPAFYTVCESQIFFRPTLSTLAPVSAGPTPLDPPFLLRSAPSSAMANLTLFDQRERTTHNSHKFGFTLNQDNHGYWKTLITPFLITNGLYGYVDGSIPCPPATVTVTRPAAPTADDTAPAPVATTPNPQHAIWIANDAHVRMLLLSTISESAFLHVQGTTTSRDVWLALERAYSPQTASREYTLKTQLLRIQMKPDETSSAYLNRAQQYATALANIGEPMKEKDLVMLVVSGLREEYNGVKSAALSRQLVFNELHALFADHEYMLQKPSPSVPPTQAFHTASSVNPPPSPVANADAIKAVQNLAAQLGLQLQLPAQTQPPQAYYAGRNNYRPRNNNRQGRTGSQARPNLPNGPPEGNRNSFDWATSKNTVFGTCNRCGIGHIPSDCPKRDPSTIRQRSQPSANFADYRSQAPNVWLPDTGSSHHVANDLSSFDSATSYNGTDNLRVGDGKGLPILNIGSSHIRSPTKKFNLLNILHVPSIKSNLLSVQKFCHDNNVYFEFHATFFSVKDTSTHTTLLTGPASDGLYSFQLPRFQPVPKVSFFAIRASPSTWHQRLGHPNPQLLKSMLKFYQLPLQNSKFNSICDSCCIGKSSKLHLLSSNFKSSNILDLVFCDVWGPSSIISSDGHKYFLLCVDHFTKFMWFYPLKSKSDVFATFKQFTTMAERQFGTKLKSVQTDWGGEFRNLSSFFQSLGIIHRLSCPHTSEQNGIVERRHRHVVETGLTLLSQSHVPRRFWHFAFDTAVYLINRMPSRTNSSTSPFQHLFKRTPDYTFLRVFGSQCFPHLRPYNQHKMDFRSAPCVFLGYSPAHHGYRCLDPVTDRVYISRHVRFNESCFPFRIAPSANTPQSQPQTDPYVSSYPNPIVEEPPPTTSSNLSDLPTPPIRFTFQRKPKPATTEPPVSAPTTTETTNTPPPSTSNQPTPPPAQPASAQPRTRPPNLRPNPKKTKPHNISSFHTSTSDPESEPPSFTIANTDPRWREAMSVEYQALIRNGTWSLVPRVQGKNIVGCKWLYKIKRDPQGNIIRHKARLVAKGYRQQPGIDYQETFSPVVKATTIRLLLSLAITQKWNLRQLDIQNAFLHGDLQETVYLQQPPGFEDPAHPDHVCLLHKSLYGLKQAPRAWFHRLSTALLQLGFKGSKTDPSLFIYSSGGTLLYMLVYVDDIIVTGNNPSAIDKVVTRLSQLFPVQDMGRLAYFLGIEVVYTGSDLILSQKKYILDILKRAGLSEAKPVSSPMTPSTVLRLGDSPPCENPVKYRQTVGALQYATLSRPDIAFAVNKVCQFMHAPTENHWSAVKRILRYLQGTQSHGLLIQHNSARVLHAYADSSFPNVTAFSDADWAGCPDDRRSTGGYAIYLGSNLISWSARKQKTVSRSSTEAEYKALADTVCEITWLRALMHELRVPMSSAPTLWCDNLGATYLSANPVFHARTKHVEIDFHFVREQVARGNLHVQFITTDDQIADVFTKPLLAQRFIALRNKLKSFDKEKDGRFRLDDFMSLCIFVQSARNLFNSFDTSKQGRVTLDLNQFIYCSESTFFFFFL